MLPAQGDIGPSVGSDVVNVEANFADGKIVYADVQFEYICEGPCYFKSMIIRFAHPPPLALCLVLMLHCPTRFPRYWWAALIITLIIAVVLFYLGFRCTPPSPLPHRHRTNPRCRYCLRRNALQAKLVGQLTRQDHGVTQPLPAAPAPQLVST